MNLERINLKIKLANLNYPDFYTKNRIYTFVNPYSYHLLRKRMDIYIEIDGIYIDGVLYCIFLYLLYGIKIRRRSFDNTSVGSSLLSFVNQTGESIYFVGASQDEIKKTVLNYQHLYPNMKILGYRNGFFLNGDEYDAEIDNIIRKSPSYIVVGMGALLQEKFLIDLKNKGFKGIGFTCGGYLRQSATNVNYFPYWINHLHLRAIYRLYREPMVWKRLYNTLIQFPVLFVRDRFCK